MIGSRLNRYLKVILMICWCCWSIRAEAMQVTAQVNADSIFGSLHNMDDTPGKLQQLDEAVNYYQRKNLQKWLAFSQEGLELANQLKVDSMIPHFAVQVAQALVRTHQADSALAFIDKYMNTDVRDSSFKSKMYQNQAFAHYSKGNYLEAAKSLLSGIDYANETREQAIINNNLGNLFQKINDPKKALEYFRKAYQLHQQSGDSALIGSTLGNIGVAQFDLLKYADALRSFHQSLAIAQKSADSVAMSIRMENIANVYKNLDQPDSTWYYYNQALDISKQLKDTVGLSSIYKNLAEFISVKLQNPKASLPIMLNAYQLAKSINDNYGLQQAQYALSEIYVSLGDYYHSDRYLREYLQLKDTLEQVNRQEIIQDLETKYQTAEKEKQLQAQEHQIFKRTNQRNIFLGLSGIALFFAVSITYFLSKQIRLTRQVHLQTAEISQNELAKVRQEQKNLALKAMLEGEDSERKRLAKELHDGLGGLLSTIKLSFSKNIGEEKGPVELIDKASVELRRIAHNLMPGTLVKYGLINAIEEYCDEINYSGKLRVDFQHYQISQPIPDHLAFQIYRIIQELLQNVLKHAHAREVLVQLIQQKDVLILTVEDDGVGLGAKYTEKKGLGMSNIRSRCEILNAEMQVESKTDEGSTFVFHIPFNENHD